MTLPYASTDVVFRSFKVMPRAEVRCVAGNIVLAIGDSVGSTGACFWKQNLPWPNPLGCKKLYVPPPLVN